MTKAELFRYLAERAGAGRPAAPAQDATSKLRSSSRPHESARAGKKALYALEPCDGRPSRKSSRKSANRQKNDAQSRMKQCVREVRPELRVAALGGAAHRGAGR